MKKKILAIMLSALLAFCHIPALAAEGPASAVDGTVTIEATIDAPEGTPVLIIILPTITEIVDDAEEDVTAQRVAGMTAASVITTLGVEYIGVSYVEADGSLTHTCKMKDSLPTGECHVIFSYIGSGGCYSADTFEHVGKDDITALLGKFNAGNKDTCGAFIDEDINGEFEDDGVTRKTPKEILRKSSADVTYYTGLSDKTDFHTIYYLIKGSDTLTSETMVSTFNETGAWNRLRAEENTLNILSTYNGTGSNKYWELELEEGSDFAGLGDDAKTSILSKIKTGGHYTNETLEAAFHDLVLVGVFQNIETREDLEDFISTASPYAEDFAGVREILENADLDEFELTEVQNDVIAGRGGCETLEDIEGLFEASLPAEGGGGDDEDTVESRPVKPNKGSSSITVKEPDKEEEPVPAEKKLPFKDVKDNHWAHAYVKQLFEKGAINGVSEEAFMPEGSIQRQDFVKILIGAMGIEPNNGITVFNDVSVDAYYTKFIMAAYENNLISGTGEGIFGVGNNISRQDAAVIMDRVLKMRGIETSASNVAFGDDASIADYAREAVANVASAGIFGGDENKNFNPKNNLSRAEACAILCRLAQKLGEV